MSSTLNSDDLNRLRTEYANRKRRLSDSNRYSSFNPANLFTLQQRQRAIVQLLRRHGVTRLDHQRIFELGCGTGGVLLEFLGYGATPAALHGADLLPDRVLCAHMRLPHLPLTCADGQYLPYATGAFDLVLQCTAFSSILDNTIKINLAREMLRVLKPTGMIVWYDFWFNPTNAHTRGIRPTEIRRLFQNCQLEFCRVTLAPPLARRLVPFSWLLCAGLEKLKVFNTHYLVAIHLHSSDEGA